jgi:predicted AlkP superfamily phosphohydrolase/phosphomutase
MKILVIGLDAATMDLIEPWAAAGHLPTLARLMREGASARLTSTPNMHSASAWTSILTGLNPGRHGLFVFSDRDFATGRQVFFKGGDRTGELIGSHLSRHGLTSGFLNVPMTYPAACEGGGFMISGLDAPSLNERAFCPPELRGQLFNLFPKYHFAPQGLGELMRAGRVNEAIGEWTNLVEIQTAAAEYLMTNFPVDFFMTVYTASDWGGHNLWPRSNEATPLLEIYCALDGAIARVLRHASDETQVYVISDHGMGRHTGASYHLADWLEARGYMVRGRSRARHSIVGAGRRAARTLLPAPVRERVKAGMGEDRVGRLQASEKDSFYSSVDWRRSVAYTEPGRHVININLEGRNAGGIVQESDYDEVCSKIIEDLRNWSDAEGNPAVESVARRDQVYSGPFTLRASDLYIYWNPAANFPEPPDEVRARGFWWRGDHRPEGILICKGPGLQSNGRADVRRELPTVYDLVPTIMHAAGLPVPEDLDGHRIQSVFTNEFAAAHPLRLDRPPQGAEAAVTPLSTEEEQLIEEKLRGLGYL